MAACTRLFPTSRESRTLSSDRSRAEAPPQGHPKSDDAAADVRLLGARAGTAGNGVVPAREVFQLRTRFDAGQHGADVDRDQRGDVGDGEAVASNKLASLKLAIHSLQPLLHDRALRVAIFGKLRQTPAEHFVSVDHHAAGAH